MVLSELVHPIKVGSSPCPFSLDGQEFSNLNVARVKAVLLAVGKIQSTDGLTGLVNSAHRSMFYDLKKICRIMIIVPLKEAVV